MFNDEQYKQEEILILTRRKDIHIIGKKNVYYLEGYNFEENTDIKIEKFLQRVKNNLTGVKFIDMTRLDIQNIDLSIHTDLECLICCSNEIVKFNSNLLPNSLIKLDCSSNKIEQLDNLPNGLKNLSCKKNKIILLNNLPNIQNI